MPEWEKELLDELRRIHQTAKNFHSAVRKLTSGQKAEIDYALQTETRIVLIENFMAALAKIEEYSKTPLGEALAEHLLDNVKLEEHVRIHNGRLVQIWNLQAAGLYSDIREGQEAAWALSKKSPTADPKMRSVYWKCVYTGHPPSKMEWKSFSDTLYAEIMEARMSVWGTKAPYWMFVEYGTASGGEGSGDPYPSFGGEQPIYKTAQWYNGGGAQAIVNDFLKKFEDAVEEGVEKGIVGGGPPPPEGVIIKEIREIVWTRWYLSGGKLRRHQYYTSGPGAGQIIKGTLETQD